MYRLLEYRYTKDRYPPTLYLLSPVSQDSVRNKTQTNGHFLYPILPLPPPLPPSHTLNPIRPSADLHSPRVKTPQAFPLRLPSPMVHLHPQLPPSFTSPNKAPLHVPTCLQWLLCSPHAFSSISTSSKKPIFHSLRHT